MLKRNLIVVGFAIVFLIFANNAFGQSTPVLRRSKTAKIKLPSPKGMNKSDLTEQLSVRGKPTSNRKAKSGSFAGTLMEGSNIKRKQPRRKRNK